MEGMLTTSGSLDLVQLFFHLSDFVHHFLVRQVFQLARRRVHLLHNFKLFPLSQQGVLGFWGFGVFSIHLVWVGVNTD